MKEGLSGFEEEFVRDLFVCEAGFPGQIYCTLGYSP